MSSHQSDAKQPTSVVPEPVSETDSPRTVGSQPVVPAGALCAVQWMRKASIFVIVIHILCFVMYYIMTRNYWPWPRRLVYAATAIACVMGGVVLCSFSKRAYSLAAVFFAMGSAIDFALLLFWSYLVYRLNERNRANDDYDYDIPTGYFAIFIVPAVLSTLGFLVASASAFTAVCNWPEDGTCDNQDQNTLPV